MGKRARRIAGRAMMETRCRLDTVCIASNVDSDVDKG